MSNIIFQASNIPYIYSKIRKGAKERFDVILEPFQAILQLALLSHTPMGTKISIKDNCVNLQYPTYSQGIVRWYNNDNKEDLIYLFQVCRRFPLFYDKMRRERNELYTLVVMMAQRGIEQLIKTYQDKERLVLLHILQLFKNLLESDDEKSGGASADTDSDDSFMTCNDNTMLVEISLDVPRGSGAAAYAGGGSGGTRSRKSSEDEKADEGVEKIFQKISEIYKTEHYDVILNVLKLIEQTENETTKDLLINGLTSILTPVYSQIKPWIGENVLF